MWRWWSLSSVLIHENSKANFTDIRKFWHEESVLTPQSYIFIQRNLHFLTNIGHKETFSLTCWLKKRKKNHELKWSTKLKKINKSHKGSLNSGYNCLKGTGTTVLLDFNLYFIRNIKRLKINMFTLSLVLSIHIYQTIYYKLSIDLFNKVNPMYCKTWRKVRWLISLQVSLQTLGIWFITLLLQV